MFLLYVTHQNERVRLGGRDIKQLQPPKASKNFVFRELQNLLHTFMESA